MSDTTDRAWEPGPTADAGYALFAKERRVVADDGTPIAYTYRNPDGPGVPVLLANGWSCSDAYWGELLPLLEEAGHPVLLPDTRGHGRSGLPRPAGRGARNLTIDDVSMPRIARDLVAVLDDAGVEEALVLGHSMGVQTALEVYRQIPDRVLGLVLVAGTAANPTKTLYGQSLADKGFPIGAAIMRYVPEVLSPLWATIGPAKFGHWGARMARAAGPKTTPEQLHPYLLHLKSADPAVMVLMAGAMRAHSAVDLLPDITTPTLVIAAGADVFTPARCSEAIHHQVVGSELITFREAGHTIPIEEPHGIADAIADFVSRRLPARPPKRRTARKAPTARKAAGPKKPAKA